ncbi:MAG TPA: rRNA maturation RNase YbeY [Solirubrobacteraceae bacterium]|nr:rRNA maturation RNase YbeY [Solirubrobacteraceae bacterium]
MLEVDVIGAEVVAPAGSEDGFDGPTPAEVEELCTLALSSAGISDGHVAVEFVSGERIRELNSQFRHHDEPTDVLSFTVDEDGPTAGPRELGDIVVCPEHTADVREAIVHGALHLSGMDHETDEGEMLALQAELMRWIG